MVSPSIQEMWEGFVATEGIDAEYTAWAFGDDSLPELATELGLLVRDGPKRATAGLYSHYVEEEEPLPEVGDYSVILDGQGEPLCIVQTTEIEVRPFGEVDARFAWDEGEGDRTLEWWRAAHIRFFKRLGTDMTEDTRMVLERFELVFK